MKAPLQPSKSFSAAASSATAQRKGLKTITNNRTTNISQRKMQATIDSGARQVTHCQQMAAILPQKKETASVNYIQRSSMVAQRTIIIENTSYKIADLNAFRDKYGAHEEEIFDAFCDIPHKPKTIEEALKDDRDIVVKIEKDEQYGMFFDAYVRDTGKKIDGGKTREAGGEPLLITAPAEGFEELTISGLIMCIGIILEAKDEKTGVTKAALGSHFVTPSLINDRKLTTQGQNSLIAQVNEISPYGAVTAKLMHVDKREPLPLQSGGTEQEEGTYIEPNKISGAAKDAYEALNLITSLLLSAGVSKVDITNGDAKRHYRLDSQGNGHLLS